MTATIPTSLPCDEDPADVTEPAWHGALYSALCVDVRASITVDVLHTDGGARYMSVWITAPGGGQLHLSLSDGAMANLTAALSNAVAKAGAVK